MDCRVTPDERLKANIPLYLFYMLSEINRCLIDIEAQLYLDPFQGIAAILVSPLNGIFALRALISLLADLCILWQLNNRHPKGTVNDYTVTSQKLQCLIRDLTFTQRNF